MSIQKFKSLEDAQRVLWNFNPDRDYYKGLADLFKLASTYAKPSVKEEYLNLRP